ncbi:hypothetical protein K502DRAFT_346166 [Neoconidiobolus thromboides FSU 785]|nr:hypothetical protein K502DRAFT_346166 [Neoconidiobolus thromboides FSU 785]
MLGDEAEKSVIVVVKNKQDTLIKFCDPKDSKNSNSNKDEIKVKEEEGNDGTKRNDATSEKTQELCTTSNDFNLCDNHPSLKKSMGKDSKVEVLIEEELSAQIVSFDYSQKDTGNLYIYASEYHSKHGQYFRVGNKLDTSLTNAMNLIHCPIIKKLNTTKCLYKQSQLSNVIKIRCERKDLLSNLLQMELAAYFHNIVQQTDVCKGSGSAHLYWFHCSKEDLA